jgi:3-hydroxyacyl-CoA dehydrogenase/enoyl-CoA hydratase/3-hydroxybutyryl-CoA epimerase
MSETIRYERGDDGIVVLTLDDPDHAVNTMNAAYQESMAATVDRLYTERDVIAGVVVASAKKTFFAGGDVNRLYAATRERASEFDEEIREINRHLRRLETLGTPVVAAINGAALGGGLEICLACHHRIAVDSPAVRLGFREVQLGLLPGGGGITRSVRLFGVVRALTELLLEGRDLSAGAAEALGLVNELVAAPDDLVPAAKRWIETQGEDFAGQAWDQKGYKIPGGTPSDAALAALLPALPANLRKQLKGANYPAPRAIMAAAVEGAQVDFDNASLIERRYFVGLATGQVAKNMLSAFFFDMQAVTGERNRPVATRRIAFGKVVVLGAGMMGAGIAYVCAKAGIEVVLKDVSQEAAERGKAYSENLVAKAVERGETTQETGDKLLSLITTTDDPSQAESADLVIEAVFEDPKVKEQVFAEIEPYLAEGALLGSNTSTLPITGLAEGVSRPADFIGLHFFSPADRMPLLEIIKGDQTSDETLHRALDLAKQIKKTPIVVNDSRGFFTSRLFIRFLTEGIAMLAEGRPAASIEQASSQAGYPAPVLQLSDEVNLELISDIRQATKEAVEAEGGEWTEHPSSAVVDAMLAAGRPGKLRGAGFYEYDDDGRRTRLWHGLAELFPRVADPSSTPLKDLEERMLFAEALEAVRCLDEGVIERVSDGNIGSILGIGFPGWTGGVFQYINGYDGGPAGFVARARELAEGYGERFEPPASLVEKAEGGKTYSERPVPVPA